MNRPVLTRVPLAAGMLMAAMCTAVSSAHDGERPTLDEMVADADLVFQGVVEEIEYVLSNPTGAEQVRVPYTFVTYRVGEILRGDDPGETLTLRFFGGFDAEKERYMVLSHAPQFDLGDNDILFVAGNTERMIPLVGEYQGRLRVIDGQVYSENGHAVQIARDGSFMLGRRHRLEEVMTTDVFGQIFVRDLGPQAVEGPSDAIGVDDALWLIAQAAEIAGAPQFAVAQADPLMPFDGPDLTAAAPPAEPEDAQRPIDAEEAAEAARQKEGSEITLPRKRSN